MSTILAIMSDFTLPLIGVSVVIALVVLGVVVSSRYKTVPPNAIGVFYGRKYTGPDKVERGFKIVTGGGKLLIPVIEQFRLMSIEAFQIEVEEESIPTLKNVPVKIRAIATCRISQNPDEQYNAVQAFLTKSPEQIAETVHNILRGHVRSTIAKLLVEQVLRDRTEFTKQVHDESTEEFKRLGIQIVNLVVQDVTDENGYIKALGQQETASVIRDAAIATANADKETKIQVSNAQREAAQVAAQNSAAQADAERDRDVKISQFKITTEQARAAADMANAIAKTEQEQKLRVLEAGRDTAAAQAQIGVQEQRAKLNERELNATIITTAKAKREAAVIEADAQQQVAERTAHRIEIEAKGRAAATVKDGEAHATKTRAVASADADATRVRLTAEADGNRANQLAIAAGTEANLLATAAGNKAAVLAVAAGIEAELLAKAKGTLELAEALKKLDERGQLLMVLEKLPALLRDGGDAGAKMISAAFTPLGEAVGSIDRVTIADMGNGDGKGGVAKFADSIPNMVASVFAKAEAMGVNIKPALKLLKLDPAQLGDMLGLVDSALPDDKAK